MNKMNFVVDEELNNEINYWVLRKGWNENKLIVDHHYEEHENECSSCENDCLRCSENTGYDKEVVIISPITSKEKITFERYCDHKIGHVWGNWYLVA